ncbi:unnamed protein product [Chilo suppressalis]|uniref:MYND-type domain-containing protein n=1 Tax=Chilo suppressalis TaxID=168631 RepID=A0ABN8B9S8_CHISP|nr:unnamed protein product [Chilo suppressalis]
MPRSLSPPLPDGSRAAPALQRLRRFLTALQQFAADVGADTGERSGTLNIEEFQAGVQECTNYPLRASVPGFLRALLPLNPLQYIRSHEHLILECGGDSSDIFAHQPASDGSVKRRASDPLFLHPSPFLYPLPSNASLFDYTHPCHYPAQGDPGFERRDVRDVSTMNASFPESRPGPSRNDDEWKNINTMLNCILSVEPTESSDIKRAASEIMAAAVRQTEERVAEVRRRAEDAVNQINNYNILHEIMAAAERQTEERVAEVRRRAEDAVNQLRSGRRKKEWRKSADVLEMPSIRYPPGKLRYRKVITISFMRSREKECRKSGDERQIPSTRYPPGKVKRQALVELQRAVGAAEAKALELVVAERSKETHPPPPPPPRDLSPGAAAQQNETCSGCNAARYCGAFCQHKDWENHHQVCSGREQKPTAMLRTSPPAANSHPKTLARSTTPITAPANPPPTSTERVDNRLSLTSLNSAERLLNNQDRSLTSNSERIALATLSTAQGLIGGIGGKK